MSFELGHDHGGETDHEHFAEAATGGGAGDASAALKPQGASLQAAELDEAIERSDHDHAATGAELPRTTDYEQQNGTTGKDLLVGSQGNDFLFPGEDTFKFNTASTASGAREFPFPNSSPGSTELNLDLKDGKLKVEGEFKDFDGAPLFSQGETEIDPKAEILNGSDPDTLVKGFLAVPEDVEGNQLSGTHLHFSPAEDSRGDFADATVVRFLENEVNPDGKSGRISGEFELNPEEQAALLAGNLYVNAHSNVDVDGNDKAGFPTGENRVNLNQNVVEFV